MSKGPVELVYGASGLARWCRRRSSGRRAGSCRGIRGGSWNETSSNLRVSDRNNASNSNTGRNNNIGGRPAQDYAKGVSRLLWAVQAALLSLLPIGLLTVRAAAPYTGGSGDGWFALDSALQLVGFGMSSSSDQFFNVGAGSKGINTIASAYGGSNLPTSSSGIRIILPAGFPCTWDTSASTLSYTGSAAAKAGTGIAFANASKTAVLPVTTSFSDGDSLNISGLKVSGCTALTSSPQQLGLDLNNDGAADITDSYSLNVLRGGGNTTAYAGAVGDGWSMADSTLNLIGFGMVSTSPQFFNVGTAAVDMVPIATAFGGSVLPTTSGNIRITIPVSLGFTWSGSYPTATLSGNAAGKVSTGVTFENGFRTAVLHVSQNFSDSDGLIISGLKFSNFQSVAGPAALTIDVNNDGVADITDTQSKSVLRGGGVASQFKGGSGDGWFFLFLQDVGTAVGTQLEGGVRLKGGTRLR